MLMILYEPGQCVSWKSHLAPGRGLISRPQECLLVEEGHVWSTRLPLEGSGPLHTAIPTIVVITRSYLWDDWITRPLSTGADEDGPVLAIVFAGRGGEKARLHNHIVITMRMPMGNAVIPTMGAKLLVPKLASIRFDLRRVATINLFPGGAW